MTVNTEEELGKAIKNDEDAIEVEGDLIKKVVRIKATGSVAWGIAIGAIAVAVIAVLSSPATAGTGLVAAPALVAPAAGALGGMGIAVSAVSIAVAGGGVAVLNKLRDYEIVSNTKEKLVLRRK